MSTTKKEKESEHLEFKHKCFNCDWESTITVPGVKSLRDQLSKEREEKEKLQAFKDYVHKRLDDAGIPTDPDSPHKAAGCRIGGRLDLVLKEREMRKELVEWMEGFKKLEPIITYPDNVPPEHEGEMIALSNALYKMKHLIAKASELDKNKTA